MDSSLTNFIFHNSRHSTTRYTFSFYNFKTITNYKVALNYILKKSKLKKIKCQFLISVVLVHLRRHDIRSGYVAQLIVTHKRYIYLFY